MLLACGFKFFPNDNVFDYRVVLSRGHGLGVRTTLATALSIIRCDSSSGRDQVAFLAEASAGGRTAATGSGVRGFGSAAESTSGDEGGLAGTGARRPSYISRVPSGRYGRRGWVRRCRRRLAEVGGEADRILRGAGRGVKALGEAELESQFGREDGREAYGRAAEVLNEAEGVGRAAPCLSKLDVPPVIWQRVSDLHLAS